MDETISLFFPLNYPQQAKLVKSSRIHCSSSRDKLYRPYPPSIHAQKGEEEKKERFAINWRKGRKKKKETRKIFRVGMRVHGGLRRGGRGHVNEFASFHGRMGFPCRWIQWPRRHNRVSLERHGRLKIRRGGWGWIGGRREDGGEETSKIRGRALTPRRRANLYRSVSFSFFFFLVFKRLYMESWE